MALAANGSDVFAGTMTDLFHSSDNGAHWTSSTAGQPPQDVLSLAFSGTKVYAGSNHGLYVSTDNGASWTPTGLVNDAVHSQLIVPDGTGGTRMYAGTNKGVLLSTDQGATWTPFGLSGKGVMALAASGTHLFAGLGVNGVFVSINNDSNWIEANTGFADKFAMSLAVIPNGSGGAHLFAAGSNGIYRSDNNAITWTAVNAGLADTALYSLAVSGTTLFAGALEGGVYRSTDNGANWTTVRSGLKKRAWVVALAVSGPNLFAGTVAGVFVSTDNGGTWNAANRGLVSSTVFCMALDGGSLYAGTWEGDIFQSTNDGADWTALYRSATIGTVYDVLVCGTHLFGATDTGVLHFADGGSGWVPDSSGLTGSYVSCLARSPVPGGYSIFAGGIDGISISTDYGLSWTAVNDGLTSTWVNDIAVSGTSLFAGTQWGGVFHSSYYGSSWTAVNSGLTNSPVRALALYHTNFLAGTKRGVFLSTNLGSSWTSVLNTDDVSAVAISRSASGAATFFAGTEYDGIFLSADSGRSWKAVNDGLPGKHIRALAVSGTSLFAAGDNCGVWRRPLSEITSVILDAGQEPMRFGLAQNYPNPFNPTTTITYSLGGVVALSGAPPSGVEGRAATTVKLVVYDLLGREVAVLVNERKAPGSYEVTFDGAPLASGVYIYRLTAGAFVASKQMVLVK